MEDRHIQEVYPLFGPEHLLGPAVEYPETLQCWCHPALKTICSQCDGNEPDCWSCGGTGTVEVERDDGICPLIVVHNAKSQV